MGMFTRIKLELRYPVDFPLGEMKEVQWCSEQFGPIGSDAISRWYTTWDWNYITYSFEDPLHATMFTLRWL